MKLYTFSSKQIKILFIVLLSVQMNAQVEKSSELFQTIKKMDNILFENGFNKCIISDMKPFISDDLEFYHDQGGLSTSKEDFLDAIRQNICSNWEKKPIRKLVKNRMEVFPLYNNGELYGAIQEGIHEFYIKEKTKDIYLTSTAKFTHVWIKDNNQWKLKRVLSYDHQQPKSENNSQKEIILSNTILENYVGKYIAPNVGEIIISIKEYGLEMYTKEMTLNIFPQSETVFFNKEAPLIFEFVKDEEGNVIKMIVQENNKIVEEAKKIK